MTEVTPRPLRVGIIGCGAVTQAIHIPTLLRMPEQWTISHVVDLDPVVAREVADRVGAEPLTDPAELIANVDVEVIAICSPHQFHAAQVIAACEAGKKAVLCEKPLCVSVDEAHAIADASRRTGVPVLTATMHLFDPAFAAASQEWSSADSVRFVESVCFLPFNDLYVNQATELFVNASAARRASGTPDRSAQMESAVLGLASHHVPLVRRFVPVIESVSIATPLAPFGYDITISGGGAIARLFGMMSPTTTPNWSLRVASENSELSAQFPPSYIQAGSAAATITTGDESRSWVFAESGYVREWEILHELASGRGTADQYMADAVADFEFASQILDSFIVLEGQPS